MNLNTTDWMPLAISWFLIATALHGSGDGTEMLDRGDAAWQRRAEGASGWHAKAEPIGEAIAIYEGYMEQHPDDLGGRWRLLRALFFHGEYVLVDPDARLATFERARDLAEKGMRQLEKSLGQPVRDAPADVLRTAVGDDPDAAECIHWAAAHWGLWGRQRGKLAAARQGVAGAVRDYAQQSIVLDPEIEDAGGLRILGRLHTEAPKVPFFTGWIDRDVAVESLERAFEIAPENLMNRLYLAEALLLFRPSRRAEAMELLEDLDTREPSPAWAVEEAQILDDARALLARER